MKSKKILAIALSLVLAVSALALPVSANAATKKSDSWFDNLVDGVKAAIDNGAAQSAKPSMVYELDATCNSVTLGWLPGKDVKSYKIYYIKSTNKTSRKLYKTVNGNTSKVTISGLTNSAKVRYKFYVAGVASNGEESPMQAMKHAVILKPTKILKAKLVKSGYNTFKISVKLPSYAKGFIYTLKTRSGFVLTQGAVQGSSVSTTPYYPSLAAFETAFTLNVRPIVEYKYSPSDLPTLYRLLPAAFNLSLTGAESTYYPIVAPSTKSINANYYSYTKSGKSMLGIRVHGTGVPGAKTYKIKVSYGKRSFTYCYSAGSGTFSSDNFSYIIKTFDHYGPFKRSNVYKVSVTAVSPASTTRYVQTVSLGSATVS